MDDNSFPGMANDGIGLGLRLAIRLKGRVRKDACLQAIGLQYLTHMMHRREEVKRKIIILLS